MTKYTQIHGAAWDDRISNSSPSLGRGWSMEDGMGLLTYQTGFRLVHDSVDRKYRGSRWFGSPNYARPPHSDRSTPDLSGLYLSFRLVREAE